MTGYRDAAPLYLSAGWTGVLPLPPRAKADPPAGYTGRAGVDPSLADVQTWSDFRPVDANLALRLPAGVVGIDVDAYDGKPGAATLAALEAKLGPLPPTVVSTSRGDGTSGIRLYRVPARPSWSDPGRGIEVIHHGWRYLVAWPSIHPEGRPYRWLDQVTGELLDGPPRWADLPDLPPAWVEHLARDQAGPDKADAATDEVVAWLDTLPAGSPCQKVAGALGELLAALEDGGSRHAATLRPVAALVRLGERGHPGVPAALAEARSAFLSAVTAPGNGQRTEREAIAEWRRGVAGAYRIVKADPTAEAHLGCRCAGAVVEQIGEPDAPSDRAVTGGTFLLDQPPGIPAVWGEGTRVLWADGEPMYVAGGVGTGKTTLGGQVALARVGLGTGTVLDLPVTDDGGRLLYLAMDRPRQIARALARMVAPGHRDQLDRRVTFWPGPLPFPIVDDPEALVALARKHDATTVVVDSVKDLGQVEKPEIGWAVNAAFQACVAEGVQVAAWHHQRKASGENRKPTKLDDVYGSHALTAGAGSVVLLWGSPGDPVVELTHLKPPADTLGPWQLTHDHDAGRTTVARQPDPLELLLKAPQGMTARNLAQKLTGKPNPSPADLERARRHLERLAGAGLAEKRGADPSRSVAALYLPTDGGTA